MKLEQHKIYEDYCLMCGKDTKSDTCSSACSAKLTMLRCAINERKVIERSGLKLYNEHSIKEFNRIQNMLGTL